MTQYIDKASVVAEIERQHKILMQTNQMYSAHFILGFRQACRQIIDFLDIHDIEQMDLDEAARHYLLHEHLSPLNEVFHQSDIKAEMQYHRDIENAYKAGFELGLKAQKGE